MQTCFANVSLDSTGRIHSKVQHLKYQLIKNEYGQSELEELAKIAVKDLIAAGVKQEDIKEYIRSGLRDPQLKKDFDDLVRIIKIQKLEKNQALMLMSDFLKYSDYQGTAYWQAGDWKYLLATTIVVLISLPFLMYGTYDVASH